MASTPITAQTVAVVGPLRDLTDGTAPKVSSNRLFESRRTKEFKIPPVPPARITKASTDNSASAVGVIRQKPDSSSSSGPHLYDEAYDTRLSHIEVVTSLVQGKPTPPLLPLKHRQNHVGYGPIKEATIHGCNISSSSPSSKSSDSRDTFFAEIGDNPSPISETAVSAFCSSGTLVDNSLEVNPRMGTPSDRESVCHSADKNLQEEHNTPTDSNNNSNWFPPPPPTPLHLSSHVGDPVASPTGRYHEHRRSFEMDRENTVTPSDPCDAITLPPFSPLPEHIGSICGDGGRASVASFLLNLPPPPPVADLLEEDTALPAIPPRDPKTTATEPPNIDPYKQPVESKSTPAKPEEVAESNHHQTPFDDGRWVIPCGRVVTTSTALDVSGSLPQWVPPRRHAVPLTTLSIETRSVGNRSAKFQSGGAHALESDRAQRPVSLAGVCSHSASRHRGGRTQTAHSFGGDAAAETVTAGTRPGGMNAESTGLVDARTMIVADDGWIAAGSHDGLENDSMGQFVRTSFDERQPVVARSGIHHQLPSGANQRQALAATAAGANVDMMTQSLIDWPGLDDASLSSSLHQQRSQPRMSHRMKAVRLTDSGLVLSPQDVALPVYHRGQRVFLSSFSSSKTSPCDNMPVGGFLFQSQLSCPPHVGGTRSSDDPSWTDVGVFEYQTAPAHAYPGQAYMLWQPHHFVGGRRRRHHNNHHHHSTQPIIVPVGDDAGFPAEKGLNSVVNVGHNGRPQVLVTGRQRSKRMTDLTALVNLPIEEQPWFHGHLPRIEAESLLRSAPPGSFLVRTSETSKAAFSLSIRRDRDFLHMKISYDPKSEAYILGEYSQPYPTVPIMVHHYTRNLLPVRGTKPILLKYPLCRSMDPFTLQTS